MILNFQPIEEKKIEQYLRENYGLTNITSKRLKMFQGSVGKAISLKDKQEEYDKIEDMIENLNKKDLIEILKLSQPLYKAKDDIFEILDRKDDNN